MLRNGTPPSCPPAQTAQATKGGSSESASASDRPVTDGPLSRIAAASATADWSAMGRTHCRGPAIRGGKQRIEDQAL